MTEPRRNELGQPIGFAVPGWTARPRPPRTPMKGRYAAVEPIDPDRHAAELHEANAQDRDGRMWTYMGYGPFATVGPAPAWARPRGSRPPAPGRAAAPPGWRAICGSIRRWA